jgi:ribonucleotide reductase alpha subunit
VDWCDPNLISSFVLSSFSEQHLNLEAADKTEYMPRNGISSLLDDHKAESLTAVSPVLFVLEKLMRSVAIREERSHYEKQRGSEKTLFKTMALNDGAGGDIGFIYFSNLATKNTPLNDLPVLSEKLRFTELKNLEVMNMPKAEELDITVS